MKMWALWHIIFVLLTWTSMATTIPAIAKTGCSEKCGNITVPYPFGVGKNNPNCRISKSFLLRCNTTSSPPQLFLGGLKVRNISVEEGTITLSISTAYFCNNGTRWKKRRVDITLGSGPFRFSDTQNKLIGFGCDTIALIRDAEGQFGSGCISLCNQQNITIDSSCSGFGCCQISIPKSLRTLNISMSSTANQTTVLKFNPCGFAFLSDVRSSTVTDLKLSDNENTFLRADSVIEWVVEEKTCDEAVKNKTSYACIGENTKCNYSENGQGYRCLCKDGFTGNPYLQGCEDIDECREPKKYPCHGTCKNKIGNYTCSCPLGMHGDGKVGCQGFRVTAIVTVIGAFLLIVVIALLIYILYKKRRKERNFLENGGMLLKHQRVRIFSEAELTKATKNYDIDLFLGEGGFGSVYKGVLPDNTQLAIKKPKEIDKTQMNQEFQQEIGIVSQVNHKNVVKLLGLCLETKVPLLVYEFISNGTLFQHVHDKRSKILATWKSRLRIATEIAHALDYLHSLADPPIIHGDVKSTNILLDDNFTAKVSDFGASVLISPGQADIATKIKGTFGYLDPEYLMTGILTEKSDVYSFGVVLVELLTGEKPNTSVAIGSSRKKSNIIQHFLSSLEKKSLSEILCFLVTDEEMEEIESFAEVARRCLGSSGVNRPSMKEVADELGRLGKLHESSWRQQNSEETEHLLGDSSYNSIDNKMNQPDTLSMRTFDIEYFPDSI